MTMKFYSEPCDYRPSGPQTEHGWMSWAARNISGGWAGSANGDLETEGGANESDKRSIEKILKKPKERNMMVAEIEHAQPEYITFNIEVPYVRGGIIQYSLWTYQKTWKITKLIKEISGLERECKRLVKDLHQSGFRGVIRSLYRRDDEIELDLRSDDRYFDEESMFNWLSAKTEPRELKEYKQRFKSGNWVCIEVSHSKIGPKLPRSNSLFYRTPRR
ncbi:MAG: hypothetical protein AABX11_05865 [Nanoarchaeota archaeon]